MLKFKIFLISLLFNLKIIFSQEVITNANRINPDGFGSQLQEIVAAVIYAELENKKFVYTPFEKMEHNYDSDPEYITKKEWLINFKDNFEINKDNNAKMLYSRKPFLDDNINRCANCPALKKIRQIFKANKDINNYINSEVFNIAIHIRRAYNPVDKGGVLNPNYPDDFYMKIINKLRQIYSSKNPLFHIFSQGKDEKFKSFIADDIVLHLDEPLERTFCALVFADILVTSPSSFGYSAGLLSENIVYYAPFWHRPLPDWISTDTLFENNEKIYLTTVK